MNILVIGDAWRWEQWKQEAGAEGMEWAAMLSEVRADWQQYRLVIDLTFDDFPERAGVYRTMPWLTVLANMPKSSWKTLRAAGQTSSNIIGINLLPGFMHMKVKEVTLAFPAQQAILPALLQPLGWQFEVVGDQAGMVTPRVVSMIINEAYYAVEQQVASRADINTSMKLGTNYPWGPFEWCEKIGVRQVYELLQAVHTETGNERYKISELLRAEYLRHKEALAANSENSGADT